MAAKVEGEGVILTLVGDFNPSIYTPFWMAANGLIDMSEAEASGVDVVHERLSKFHTSWFELMVGDEKFQLASLGQVSIRTFDLMVRIFSDLLPHTPLKACGINYVAHFRVDSYAVLHKIGDLLAPKAAWGPFGDLVNAKPPRDVPHAANDATYAHLQQSGRAGGLRTIALELAVRPDDLPGSVLVKIEPSHQIHPGIYVEVNDHYQLTEKPSGSRKIVSMVENKFDESMGRAKEILEHFIRLSSHA